MEFLIVEAPCRFSQVSMVRIDDPGADLRDGKVPKGR